MKLLDETLDGEILDGPGQAGYDPRRSRGLSGHLPRRNSQDLCT